MYYLFYGKDTAKSRKKIGETVSAFQKKNPHSNVFRLSADDFSQAAFLEYLSGQSLFSDKFLITLDGVLKIVDVREFVLKNLEAVSSSHNVFIFLEEELKKADLYEVSQFAEKVFKFDLDEKKKDGKGFNIFSIADTLGEKDKKKLWVIINKAERAGLSSEEIFWKLSWQVKNMLIAKAALKKGDWAVEKLKISPFVLAKSKKYSKNFTEDELETLFGKLVSLCHESRRGFSDFDTALEAFVLTL
jgi:DNA polymerase III delta subunit